jgi:hypothetical protein
MTLTAPAALAALLALATPALAASPFDGTWTFDPARSQLAGDTISYEKTATGYRFSDGGVGGYDFGTDGRDYPTAIAGRTVAVTTTPSGYVSVYKTNGVAMTTAERTFSPDGRTMTVSATSTQPDGTTVKETDVYQRVGDGSGLAGRWRSVKVDAPATVMSFSTPAPNQFTMSQPAYKLMVTGALDGSPDVISGPLAAQNLAASVQAVSPTEWDYHLTLNGKPFEEGVWKVSADGRTLTDTSWTAGRRSEASTSVYTKS